MLDLVVFFLFILTLALISNSTGHIKTENAYFFASKGMGFLALTSTLVMTEFNSATLLAFSGFGYGIGLKALLFPLVFLIGLLFYGLVVAKKWKEYDGYSVAGYFSERYSSTFGKLASLFLQLAMVGFSSTYLKSLTLIFSPLFSSFSPLIVSVALTFSIASLCLKGGLHAIVRVDCVSMVIMLFFFPYVCLWQFNESPWETISFNSELFSSNFLLSLIVLTMFTYILAPWYGQKIFAAKSQRVAFWSSIASAFLVYVLYASAIITTYLLRLNGSIVDNWQLAFPLALSQLPIGFKGLGYALLFATSATTLTGVWSALSSMFIIDFFPQFNERAGTYRGILVTLVFASLTLILSNTLVDQIFEKMILANITVAALAFSLLGGFYWKKASTAGAIVSSIIGALFAICAFLFYGEAKMYTWYWAFGALPLSFGSGIVASYLLPSNHDLIEKIA